MHTVNHNLSNTRLFAHTVLQGSKFFYFLAVLVLHDTGRDLNRQRSISQQAKPKTDRNIAPNCCCCCCCCSISTSYPTSGRLRRCCSAACTKKSTFQTHTTADKTGSPAVRPEALYLEWILPAFETSTSMSTTGGSTA